MSDKSRYMSDNHKKKSHIRETSNISTDADSSTDTTVGWTKNTQKPKKNKNGKNYPKQKNRKTQNQRYTLRPEVSNQSGSVVSTMFCKAKSAKKQTFFTRRFWTASQQKCSIMRPLLSSTFPQGFQISKNFGHSTSGSGGKIGIKIQYIKRGQTHRQTHRLCSYQIEWAQWADSMKTFIRGGGGLLIN